MRALDWISSLTLVKATFGQSAPRPRVVTPGQIRVRRFFMRAEARVATLPTFLPSLAALCIVGGAGLYGSVLGGQFESGLRSISTDTGFDINAVVVSGQHYLDEGVVVDALDLAPQIPLALYDIETARAHVEDLSWVKDARVRKLYPNQIMVELNERQPFSIWQSNGVLSVVDVDGHVLTGFNGRDFADLPRVIGKGAEREGGAFLDVLSEFPSVQKQVRASAYVAERRWTLVLKNGVSVKLPEFDYRTALENLVVMDARVSLLSKDIKIVDMRLKDRLVLELTENAALRRAAQLEELGIVRRGSSKI